MSISLRPSTYTSGGLVDDVDVTLKELRFMLWDYDGKADADVPALRVTMETEDGEESMQYFSAGRADHFMPTEDGLGLDQVGARTSINESTNFATFMRSLIEVGCDESKFDEDISALEGMNVHVRRIPQKERGGFPNTRPDGQPRMVLTVTKINSVPWDEDDAAARPAAAKARAKPPAAAKAKAKPAGAKAAPAAAVDDDDLMSDVTTILNAGGTMTKTQVMQAVLRDGIKNKLPAADRKARTERAHQEEFLNAGVEAGLWTIDGNDVTAV